MDNLTLHVGSPFEWHVRSRIEEAMDPEVLEKIAAGSTVPMNFRCDADLAEKIQNVSSFLGVSKSELLRELISDRLYWAYNEITQSLAVRDAQEAK